MSRIKILHILTDSNIGGAGHQLLALLDKQSGINSQTFEPIVVLPQNAKLTPVFQSQDITCVELPYLAENSFSLKAVSVLLTEIKKLRPHIIHTHASLSGRVAARLYKKCKIVYTRHSVFEPASWQKRFPMRNILGWINNYFSDAIIAVSPAAKDNLLALGTSGKKIHVIFNGTAPTKEYSGEELEQLRKKYDIPQGVFVLAQIARLTEVKGQNDVLDAAKNLPNAIVLMAGDGETRPHLEARIKNEGITNARLLGFVTDVSELLAVIDAQLSASFGTEATSMALIQGMSVGKPAIVTDYGGNPYVISNGENGLIIPIRSPKALAEAVNTLQNDPALYASISAKARQIYAARFTLEETVNKTEKLYRGLT